MACICTMRLVSAICACVCSMRSSSVAWFCKMNSMARSISSPVIAARLPRRFVGRPNKTEGQRAAGAPRASGEGSRGRSRRMIDETVGPLKFLLRKTSAALFGQLADGDGHVARGTFQSVGAGVEVVAALGRVHGD